MVDGSARPPEERIPEVRGFAGVAYRWLVHTDVQDEAVRRALRDTTFERTAPLFLGLASTLLTGALVFVLTHARWPVAWVCLDGALVAGRYWVTARAKGNQNSTRTRLHAVMLFCGLAWALAFGLAAFACVLSRMPSLQILAAANIAGGLGAITGRNAATPRYGMLAMTFLTVPFVVAVALLHEPGGIAVAVVTPLLVVGMYRTLLQNHEILIRLFDAEMKATQAARTDAVTGLPNRTLLGERLEALTRGTQRARLYDHFSILCVDLDRFKAVNDRYGHPTGDALLREVAQRLRDATRDVDVVCRTGGDEFVILLTGTPAGGAALVAERIIESVALPFDLGLEVPVSIGASIGVVTASTQDQAAEALLAAADRALYAAKAHGRGRYVVGETDETVST